MVTNKIQGGNWELIPSGGVIEHLGHVVRTYVLRGLGLENGANVTGKYIDAQKIISDEYPSAIFVPCTAHTLFLFVNDVAKYSHEFHSFFNVQELFIFSLDHRNGGIVVKNG